MAKVMRIGLVMAVCAVAMLWQLDVLNVTIMEARNFISAREMIDSGDFIIPTLNGEYRLQKPPLPTWMTAGVAAICGNDNLFWLRVPAVILGLLSVFFTILLFRRFSSRAFDPALVGVLLTTSFYFFFTARSGMWDIFAQGFMIMGIYFYSKYWLSEKLSVPALIGFAVGLSASIMSKGPVAPYGLFLPFLFAFHFIYYKEVRWGRKKIILFISFLVWALGLASIWPYLINNSEAGQAAAAVLAKETKNWTSYEVKPFYYYWSFPIQSGIWTALGFLSLIAYAACYKKIKDSPSIRFYFWWTLAVVFFLSMIPEKKSRYLLPVLFPLALFLSGLVQEVKLPRVMRRMITGGLILTATAVMVAAGIILFENVMEIASDCTRVLGGSLVLLSGVGALYYIWNDKWRLAMYSMGTAMFISILFFINSLGHFAHSTEVVNSFERFQTESDLEELPLFAIGDVRPEMIWHIGRQVKLNWTAQNDESHREIGVFSNKKLEQEIGRERLAVWELISQEYFDHNPVNLRGKPNPALQRYFTILKRK